MSWTRASARSARRKSGCWRTATSTGVVCRIFDEHEHGSDATKASYLSDWMAKAFAAGQRAGAHADKERSP